MVEVPDIKKLNRCLVTEYINRWISDPVELDFRRCSLHSYMTATIIFPKISQKFASIHLSTGYRLIVATHTKSNHTENNSKTHSFPFITPSGTW